MNMTVCAMKLRVSAGVLMRALSLVPRLGQGVNQELSTRTYSINTRSGGGVAEKLNVGAGASL